ncbi:predicted coding region AF_1335 [Archaeoglobus fulgidus DSM 4304]|uniref:Uncharacterized protein AF_1335 n=3 Tax=Archaeoglobus fulgidus TaxID=2234 RepID=Y1335_ARCFU|nr:RecName: Full=Uncharacterized protein AF_1335 [Archaeoglobus fulgidus DSM 4304]AAB89913.1 predicted coding region AF_1335 [Archaeoglobus fulgidus DSM 4304]
MVSRTTTSIPINFRGVGVYKTFANKNLLYCNCNIVSMEKTDLLMMTFAIVNLADYMTTVKGIEMGFHELNEFVSSLNPASFLLLKIAIVATAFALLLYTRRLSFSLGRGIYIGLVAGLAISTAVLGICSVHNLLLLTGFPEVEFLVKVMTGVLALI